MSIFRTLRRRRRGATVTEMAIVLPMFILITFGIADWAWVFFVRQTMFQAARASARAMAVQENTAAQGEALAQQTLNAALSQYNFTINIQNVPANPEVTVNVTIPMSDVELTGLTGVAGTNNLRATVSMIREGL